MPVKKEVFPKWKALDRRIWKAVKSWVKKLAKDAKKSFVSTMKKWAKKIRKVIDKKKTFKAKAWKALHKLSRWIGVKIKKAKKAKKK
jgi:hypothetical protein